MTQKTIKNFKNQLFCKPPRKIYPTNKTDVYHVDDLWSLDFLDSKDYGPENNRGYRYILAVVDNFSKFGWTRLLKNKNAQTKKDSFENILISSKGRLSLLETYRGREFYKNIFLNFLINKIFKH